jgi:hypothetical protein
VAALLLLAVLAFAQSTTRPQYMDHAAIEHAGSTATVTANHPAPFASHEIIQSVRATRWH